MTYGFGWKFREDRSKKDLQLLGKLRVSWLGNSSRPPKKEERLGEREDRALTRIEGSLEGVLYWYSKRGAFAGQEGGNRKKDKGAWKMD